MQMKHMVPARRWPLTTQLAFPRMCCGPLFWDDSFLGLETFLVSTVLVLNSQFNSIYFCSSDPEVDCGPQDIEHVISV